MWYYKEHGLSIPADINQRVEMVLDGYQRKVAGMKLDGKMPVFEGKLHLTFEGYRLLARAFFKSSSTQMLFAWPYLVMQWNLMARATSVASMMMEHVSWETDALIVSLPKHKGDQEGTKCYPKHLYANAIDPIICPVLALAVLVFTRVLRYDPDGTSGQESLPNYRLFDGTKSESRFSDLFKKTVALLPQSEAQQLGGGKGELGTHSVRKGAATYCAGMVNGPTPVHIYLRAGWNLGGVQDRYLFAGSGGDQLTGRVLSGLPFSESAFASLPPHLDNAAAAEIAWPTVFPLYTRLPESFKRALPYMLASISYHEEWLRSNLPAMHPLFSTPLFTSGTLTSLRASVCCGCYRSPRTGLVATGIPPHLAMSNELTAVVKQSEALKSELLSKCAALPTDITAVLLSKFQINGAIPLTAEDLKAALASAVLQMRADLREALPDAARAAAPVQNVDGDDPRFRLWQWGGRLHMVPEGWRLASTDVMSTWRLWYFGNVAAQIAPLRRLKKMDLADDAQVTQWTKTNGVMRAITAQMVRLALVDSPEAVGRLSEEDATAAFMQAIAALMEHLRPGATHRRGRWTEMAIPTLYQHVLTAGKRPRQAAEQPVQGGEAEAEAERPRQRAAHAVAASEG